MKHIVSYHSKCPACADIVREVARLEREYGADSHTRQQALVDESNACVDRNVRIAGERADRGINPCGRKDCVRCTELRMLAP